MRRIVSVLACVAALSLTGEANAGDAEVTATAAHWSAKIAGPARQLQARLASAATAQEAIGVLRPFTATAAQGAKSIADQRASSRRGARVRALTQAAFASYAAAGRLLIQAVGDYAAARPQRQVDTKVDKALGLVRTGAMRLATAARLIGSGEG